MLYRRHAGSVPGAGHDALGLESAWRRLARRRRNCPAGLAAASLVGFDGFDGGGLWGHADGDCAGVSAEASVGDRADCGIDASGEDPAGRPGDGDRVEPRGLVPPPGRGTASAAAVMDVTFFQNTGGGGDCRVFRVDNL